MLRNKDDTGQETKQARAAQFGGERGRRFVEWLRASELQDWTGWLGWKHGISPLLLGGG